MAEEKKGFFKRLVSGLAKTRDNIVAGFDSIFSGYSSIDDDFYEELEEILVMGDIGIKATSEIRENLKKCRVQGKYAGKVTDVYKGIVYIRLSNGVNAVAHSCYDARTPGKKDDVSFVVTRIDEERGVAVGIITRIIRRNL